MRANDGSQNEGLSPVEAATNKAATHSVKSKKSLIEKFVWFVDEKMETAAWDDIHFDPILPGPNNPFRRRLGLWILSSKAEMTLGLIIFVNIVLIIQETDSIAKNNTTPEWLQVCNTALMTFYTVEVSMRLMVFQTKFIMDRWNIFDALVVGVDLSMAVYEVFADEGGSNKISPLRMVRALRLARVLHVLRQFRELNLLILSFSAALKSTCFGMLMVLVMVLVWSILAVQFIHPVNSLLWEGSDCRRCAQAYQNVWSSCLTIFQQAVAGDSWGHLTIPIMEKEPFTIIFFLAVFVSVNLAMLNLILAVIVESAQAAKSLDDHRQSVLQEQAMRESKKRLLELGNSMDLDVNGKLTINEFLSGFEESQEFSDIMKAMDINRQDLKMVFAILDVDHSGDVAPEEFVDELYRLKSHQTQQVLFAVTEIRKLLLASQPKHALAEASHEPTLEYGDESMPLDADKGSPSKEKQDNLASVDLRSIKLLQESAQDSLSMKLEELLTDVKASLDELKLRLPLIDSSAFMPTMTTSDLKDQQQEHQQQQQEHQQEQRSANEATRTASTALGTSTFQAVSGVLAENILSEQLPEQGLAKLPFEGIQPI